MFYFLLFLHILSISKLMNTSSFHAAEYSFTKLLFDLFKTLFALATEQALHSDVGSAEACAFRASGLIF